MRVVLHPEIFSDVQAITDYYRGVAGPELGEEFYRELRRVIVRAAEQPGSFAAREQGLRRANLLRFPIISCFAWLATRCGFLWSATTTDRHHLECTVANAAQLSAPANPWSLSFYR